MVRKAETIEELLETCPKNQIIGDNLIRAWKTINDSKYKKIVCSISGGSDSDVMLDIVWRCDKDNKVTYVWFNTGLEYQAAKEHLKYLENKYNIEILSYHAIKPIPLTCKQYGQPFLSKYVSEMIQRLQRHNFQWEEKPFEELYKRYPKCKIALKWWCNSSGDNSRFNINRNKWLKEFMIQNPPNFKISNVCCNYAKKAVIHKLINEFNFELSIIGVRKAEGGVRSTSYKSCFDENGESKNGSYDNYRPLFWYSNLDKQEYEEHYEVTHSNCYVSYGLKRTGCAGCPFGRNFEQELEVIENYEPKLFKAVNNIFKESYEYTRRYKEFCKMKNEEEKLLKERSRQK